MMIHMSAQMNRAFLAQWLFFASLMLPAFAWGWHGDAIHVTSGESIQAAIDSAHSGQLIFVEAGTYAEQLTVTTDCLRLVGKGAVLVPPNSPVQNTCSGLAGNDTQAGICITGQDIELADFVVEHRKVISVGRPIQDILVTGFEIRNFTGLNIAVVGGENVQVVGNTLYDGSQYGCLTVGSQNTHIDANNVASTGDSLFIGICMDDMSGVKITNNYVSNYYVGLCVQTNGAYLSNNKVTEACWAVFVDPFVQGAQVFNNDFSSPNPICATDPDLQITGVALVGASNAEVKGNNIRGMTSGGVPGFLAAGVAIFDDPTTGAISSGNMIDNNILHDNDVDIFIMTNGTGNVASGNQCTTPASLCG